MFEKNTGNVFQNHGQRFGKGWATFFRGLYMLLVSHLFIFSEREIPQ